MARGEVSKRYFELTQELQREGASFADAVRQVASELGRSEAAVRAGIYSYRHRHPDLPTSAQGRDFDSYMADIRSLLESAKASLEADVQYAKERLDEAQRAYDRAVAARDEKLAEVNAKLEALS